MTSCAVAKFNDLRDRDPSYALVGEVDLVVVRIDDDVSVFYCRCPRACGQSHLSDFANNDLTTWK